MSTGSVLIADDEETFRESTSRLLRREGFDCHCVQDAEEAIESLRHVRYDALVSDIRMPHNPDLRIVKGARDLDCHLPIILVTGYPSADSAIRGIEMAVDGYLTKPLEFDELLALLYKAVGRSRDGRRLSVVIERLCSVVTDLETENSALAFHNGGDKGSLATIRTLAACLSDLLVLWHEPRRIMVCGISVNYWNAPSSRSTARPFCMPSMFSKKRRTASSPSNWQSYGRISRRSWESSREFFISSTSLRAYPTDFVSLLSAELGMDDLHAIALTDPGWHARGAKSRRIVLMHSGVADMPCQLRAAEVGQAVSVRPLHGPTAAISHPNYFAEFSRRLGTRWPEPVCI